MGDRGLVAGGENLISDQATGQRAEIRTPAAAGAAFGIHFSGRYRLRKMPAAPRLEAGDVYRSIESRSRK